MDTKVRIKLGTIEIDFEGSEDFLKAELPNLLNSVSQLYQELNPLLEQESPSSVLETGNIKTSVNLVGTTSNLAAKLGCKNGSDLMFAAAARLTLGLGKDTFQRQELLQEMKSAKGYYNVNISSNLSKHIQTAIKSGKLKEVASETYALSATEKSRIEAILAN